VASFSIDMAKFGAKTIKKMRLAARRIALDVFGRVIKRTPVDTGRLRGNWQTTVARPAEGEVDVRGRAQTRDEARVITDLWGGEGSVFLTNNLPYAEAIEMGHSQQAPSGMVRITIVEFPGIVEHHARGVGNI
jgi:hypothetical protein